MSLFIILLVTAIGIGTFHMLAPDHWLPIMALSSARNYTVSRRCVIGASIGAIHAVLSSLVALFILFLGLTFLSSYLYYLFLLSIALLLGVGIYFIVNGYLESTRTYREVENSVLAVSVFPDLAMIPLLLAGFSLGFSPIAWILAAFIIASSASLMGVVYLGTAGVGKKLSGMRAERMDYLIALALFLTAIFVYLFPSV
ncbi:MAG: hypothetical protein M1533_02815 [Candidatus Thermoplasmatota archaeon]|nr:hypothetical protein [Candidatus Thermoplasmatota archaeon]